MNPIGKLDINVEEPFRHLRHAPIVEAVVEIRAHPTVDWTEAAVRHELESKLPDYAFLDSHRAFQYDMKMVQGKPPDQVYRDLGWSGMRFRSADEKAIARFSKDGFAFSRLEPYEAWERLSDESTRLWMMFIETAHPIEIGRIGVRFINRIQVPAGERCFEHYISPAPKTPRGLELPFQNFMHHDVLDVPGHPYAINVVRMMQLQPGNDGTALAIILDIDVFTTTTLELQESTRMKRLNEMRWLKNKVFFGSVTSKALEALD